MNKTLYILGNGFDKAHSMPVGYECFKRYLQNIKKGAQQECANCIYCIKGKCETQKCYLLSLLNTAIENKDNWSDFEESLAKMDFRDLDISSTQKFDNLIDNFSECLQEAFHSWIDNIAVPPCERRLFKFDKSAFYLTFNYTMVLEEMYKICPTNVYHIHSSFVEKQDSGRKYIFGHSSPDMDIQKYMKKPVGGIKKVFFD